MDASSFSKDKCFKCGDLVDYGAILAMNRAYHKGCFQCTDCGKVLQARFNSMKDSPYCDNCFEENGERCSKCQGLIIGDSLKSGDKYFHTYCMKCSICEVELTGTYFTSGNNFICEKDYKASLEACSVCGTTLTGGFYKINDKPFCDKDYKKQLAACGICGGGVEGKLLKLGDQVFHPTCFNCTVCGMNLAGVSFSQDEDQKVYCTKDFQRKYAAKCSGCGEPIVPGPGETTAERVRVQGSDFHPSCFKCQDCSLVFDSRKPGHECYPLDKLFLCKPCNIQRLNQL
ncbi:thyroid receptor-interacting protein 6 [Eurytemora carolleeae]|uniref:thyroid receptor-interacting protein 6 n=1 Tax=Eurytemora carolleeae TaxID=1294199 RepID=UPI000C78DBB4|nr:thyroid receptor-interacting protein 6 [Eurytemora carolleeae]|eukprot:XP_023343435.1 thyroid receptor-interacting protein 6-like [Eurytemora affinis]